MDPDAWKRLETSVDRALELEGAARRAFLDRLALEDPQLGGEVEAFLVKAVAARGFLDVSPERRAELMDRLGEDEWVDLEQARVGPYRLLSTLGRGGMGVVFLAARADGQFEQQVALKLVKRGMDTDEILERFRNERQILARLDHPNIARLFDGGVSEAGQPYFAMERVSGTALTAHCDAQGLPIDERLRLLVQVCDAVDYAHRNLVVHRDLKPSNILVTAERVAKLLDFGIAKVLDPARARELPTVTQQNARPLTVAYAAPEQFLGQPVTTATDVYALGAILHELLCGRLLASVDGLARADVERVMLQREREQPSLVSRRAEQAGPSAADIAGARGLSVPRLAQRLRGDLDNIVGMALRLDPEHRYPSARALGEDLRRHLAGKPVAARADTLAYRSAKFVGRHRLAVAAASLVTLSLAAGIVGTLWQAREALRQARKAEEVKQFVFHVFGQSDPNVAKGQEPAARQLLAEGARRISELASQPELEAEMLLFVGQIDYRLGLAPEARPLFTRALELRRRLYGEDSLATAEAQVALATVAMWQSKFDEAETLLGAAVATRSRLRADDHPDTAYARGLAGRVRLERGDLAGAERELRRAVADERRHLPAPHAELASNINALGRVAHAKSDFDEAERLYHEALEMRLQLFGPEHTRVSESQLNLAAVMRDRGDARGAEAWFRRVLDLDRRLLGATHDKLASDLNNLGSALVVLGEYAEAEERLRESLQIRERLYGAESPKIAIGLHALARPVRGRGRLAEAESLSRRALGLALALLGDEHANVGNVREELAQTLCAQGRLTEAESLARRALSAYRAKLPADHPWASGGLVTLAHVLTAARRPAEAEPLLVEAMDLRQRKFGEGDFRTAEARLELGECLLALGRVSEAREHLAAARTALNASLGAQHPLTRRAEGTRKVVAR